jgi:hypothetical protein
LGRDRVLQEPGSAAWRPYRGEVLCECAEPAAARKLLSSERFSVDGVLIEAWVSMKSFVPKDGGNPPSSKGSGGGGSRNAERDARGEKRKNHTHATTTDPDAWLFRKGAGKEAKLCHMGHLRTENVAGCCDCGCTPARLAEHANRDRCAHISAIGPARSSANGSKNRSDGLRRSAAYVGFGIAAVV